MGRKDSQGIGDRYVDTAIFKMDKQGPVVQHMYAAAWMGGEFGGEKIDVYMAESLCCSPKTVTTSLIGFIVIVQPLLLDYTPIKNKKF